MRHHQLGTGRIRTALGIAAIVAAPALATIATAPAAGALTTITVTTTNDGGAGSLRDAFDQANDAAPDNAEIVLATGARYQLDDCELGALEHDEANTLTITGHGSTIEQTCEGDRVITNIFGGAGHLTLIDVTITGGNVNTTTGGGGIGATSTGLTLVNTTIAGNSAGTGGAVFVTGQGSLVATNSTFADNVATSTSGTGGVEAQGSITLAYVTITGNTAGGTDEPANLRTGDTLTSFGSVIAQPLGTDTYNCVVQSTGVSQGYNWSDDDTCELDTATDVDDGIDPGLLPLAPGLPTGSTALVRVPVTGTSPLTVRSPLIDAIPNGACQTGAAAGVTTDELLAPRPSPTGGACDIGAIEVQATAGGSTPPPEVVVAPRFTG
ncbi:MAG: choice-of-anchor Q domain-containing protein [Acidimicrobiia bacterium]